MMVGPFIMMIGPPMRLECTEYGSALIWCYCGKQFYGSGKKAWRWARKQADKHTEVCTIARRRAGKRS